MLKIENEEINDILSILMGADAVSCTVKDYEPTFYKDNALKVSFYGTRIPEYVSSLNPKLSAGANFAMEATINGDLFAALCGVDMARGKDFTVEFDRPISVQVRHHRKKCINKKWAKRYGYKTIFERYRLLDVSVKYHEHDEMLSINGSRLLKM